MTGRAYLARRVLFALVAVWLVLSTTFFIIVVAPNTGLQGLLGTAAFGGASVEELERLEAQYLSEHNLERPLYVRYGDWLYRLSTLQWGESYESGEPVRGLVVGGLARTMLYVVPATVLAVVLGLAAGLYGALHPDSAGDRSARLGTYLALGVPNFFVGAVAVYLLGQSSYGSLDPVSALLIDHVLPILLLGTTIAGAMLSYTRAETREYVGTAFVKLVRAKGASERRVAAHVLKNAVPPLIALLFGELLAVLVLGVFIIEVVFGIDGFGRVVLDAVHDRDMPVLLSTTLVVVVVGVGGNLLGDLVTGWLDPRLAED